MGVAFCKAFLEALKAGVFVWGMRKKGVPVQQQIQDGCYAKPLL